MGIKHAFESPITDLNETDIVGPDDWNAEHVGFAETITASGFRWQDECMWHATSATLVFDGGTSVAANGTGAVATNATAVSGHPGILSMTTGTTTTGRCTLIQNNAGTTYTNIFLGIGEIRFGAIVKVFTLSDGTNRFLASSGLATSFGVANSGVYFRYQDNVNSGKWEAVCVSATTETVIDSGITVAADPTWYKLEFVVNAAGSSVEFFIDDVSLGTTTTNIPTIALALMPASINKLSLGTSGRAIQIDAYWCEQTFTTPR